MTTRPVPLDEALKELDSPEAVADRKRRAQKWAAELEGRDRGTMFTLASPAEIDSIYAPFRTEFQGTQLHGAALHEAERKAGAAADRVVAHQCEIQLWLRDEHEIYNDPDRQAAQKVWHEYSVQVAAVAFSAGDKEPLFLARFRELVADRNDAEAFGDAEGVRAAEAKLFRLTGAAWPSSTPAEPLPTNGSAKARTRRHAPTAN